MQDVDELATQTIKRYSDRYRDQGRHIRTLGWGSAEQQRYRFEQTLKAVNIAGMEVVDIGCGFADYYAFLRQSGVDVKRYVGYDINPDFIAECTSSYENVERTEFSIFNLHDTRQLKSLAVPVGEVAVMLGLLNVNFYDSEKNLDFSRKMIRNALELVSSTLIVDFLSTERALDYPKEDFVYYHRPAEMLDYAFSLSSNVRLYHDYAPIPQKEFMLVIEK